MRGFFYFLSALLLVGSGVATPAAADSHNPYTKNAQPSGKVTFISQYDGEVNRMVVCRLPSRVRKLGPSRVALAAPRLARVKARECAERGGQIVRQ